MGSMILSEVEGTDIMSFKFDKQNEQEGRKTDEAPFNYTAGQYAYFDI